jgi:hypothetical protein
MSTSNEWSVHGNSFNPRTILKFNKSGQKLAPVSLPKIVETLEFSVDKEQANEDAGHWHLVYHLTGLCREIGCL